MFFKAPSPEPESKSSEIDAVKIEDAESTESLDSGFPDDSFLMVSQLQWEDDVIWDGSEIKHKVRVVVILSKVRQAYFSKPYKLQITRKHA